MNHFSNSLLKKVYDCITNLSIGFHVTYRCDHVITAASSSESYHELKHSNNSTRITSNSSVCYTFNSNNKHSKLILSIFNILLAINISL